MKKKCRFRRISLWIACVFLFTMFAGKISAFAATETPELLITEIMPMSQSGDDLYEYIEIYNNSEKAIDIKNYRLPYQDIDITSSKTIQPKGVLVICPRSNISLEKFNSFYSTSLTEDKFLSLSLDKEMLSNSSQSILITNDDGIVVVRASYREEDFDPKKSITYKYPQSRFDMISLGKKSKSNNRYRIIRSGSRQWSKGYRCISQ